MTKKHNLSHFFDILFWFLVSILPFLIWKFQIEAVATTDTFFTWVNNNMAFGFIKDIFDNVASSIFNSSFPLSGFLSYLVAAEIFHVLFDVVVFIPRLAHKFVNWGIDKC